MTSKMNADIASSGTAASRRSTAKLTSFSLARLVLVGLLHIGVTCARPLSDAFGFVSVLKKHDGNEGQDEPKSPDDARLWIYLGTAMILVLLGGAFAGLTIALMGQDEVYLQVIAASGEKSEKKTAAKVLKLLKRGKHWVLVTLLVGNVITNETLPIVLDRSIGGGYAAAISSTVLVIIFGEIVPQSICVRYGLPIGAAFSSFVLVLMWVTAPITWPIAKLLDYLLGEDHGTTYKKAGLKTLVTLHKTMGGANGERLNEDEVSIISGVLDLKEKSVGSIMTPMNDVFTLPSDAILDEEMMDDIVREGYSRIPIHQPKNKGDFVGMLLVKMLITYDPEDARKVSDFALATLPETSPETSCLDIINFFQEGKSHMVLVSDYPGQTYGALGVVTLEDVIEELIGEEIIDESDVYVDVHKAIRRTHLAPTHRPRGPESKGEAVKGEVIMDTANNQAVGDEQAVANDGEPLKENNEHLSVSNPLTKHDSAASPNRPSKPPRQGTFLMRRKSSNTGVPALRSVQMGRDEMREAMKKLGPSNLASHPKQSRLNTIKVKPGFGPNLDQVNKQVHSRNGSISTPEPTTAQLGIGEDLLRTGIQPKDGTQLVYWGGKGSSPGQDDDDADGNKNPGEEDQGQDKAHGSDANVENNDDSQGPSRPERLIIGRTGSHSTVGSLKSPDSGSPPKGWRQGRNKSGRRKSTTARSGSITQNVVEAGGVKKLVLEMARTDDEGDDDAEDDAVVVEGKEGGSNSAEEGSMRRRTKKKANGTGVGDGTNENTPLLSRGS